MIDTHAHLDACADPPSELLQRAREAGVTRVITIGTGIDSSRRALAIAEGQEGVFAALGIDPHQAGGPDATRLDELRDLFQHHESAVAVGETGLDNFHRHASSRAQRELFDAHLQLASDLAKPIVIHSRDADKATAAALHGFDGPVVLHCFSQPGLLPTALERGYYVSFAGNVTYPRADELRVAAARVAGDRILAETDSPYLAPQPVRGQPSEPAHVTHTVAALAAARGDDPDELAARIEANAARAFSLP